MSGTVTVLGATGRFGQAATHAFAHQGWRVTATSRTGQGMAGSARVPFVACDAFNADEVAAACEQADVIVNALNPPYDKWEQAVPVMTRNVISAACKQGATVMLPGNIYNYGHNMPSVLNEQTPQQPSTRKGQIRYDMELAYRQAREHGVQTLILRGGDFIEGRDTGNWFESQIAKDVIKGKLTYPGRMDAQHAWAYVPDMARAMAQLAAIRETLPSFDEFGFAGYSLDGQQLKTALEQHLGKSLTQRRFPWPVLKLAGNFSPLMREVLEMRYLWDTPHRIEGSKLATTLPEFEATPLNDCLRHVLPDCEKKEGGVP